MEEGDGEFGCAIEGVMMLRVSACLAILVGVFLVVALIRTVVSFGHLPSEIDPNFLAKYYGMFGMFAAAIIAGGVLAMWKRRTILLAAPWGLIVGIRMPALVRPTLSAETMRKMVADHGGAAWLIGPDTTGIVLVTVALIGLGLCLAAESRLRRIEN